MRRGNRANGSIAPSLVALISLALVLELLTQVTRLIGTPLVGERRFVVDRVGLRGTLGLFLGLLATQQRILSGFGLFHRCQRYVARADAT
ncbi:MAG: hypothetical protein NVS3B18_16880 [Candidatus Dormibacteria bacterium]